MKRIDFRSRTDRAVQRARIWGFNLGIAQTVIIVALSAIRHFPRHASAVDAYVGRLLSALLVLGIVSVAVCSSIASLIAWTYVRWVLPESRLGD